jgi:acyl-CoA reductase-like NAD-dependent aldehyde dehydrogenase
MISENKNALINAVQSDLGKKIPFEIICSEINLPLDELDECIGELHHWMTPESVNTNLAALPACSYIYKDPVGVVLVISPWNYPINLALVPLIGAISAGNAVLLKASRHSVNTGRILEKLIPQYVDNTCIAVESDGGAEMITKLIEEKWDHIFFTGSVDVGKVVYAAAAKHLTPVTLELGGKNPCIVDKEVDIDFAAKKIAWGKFWNCGQTCITSDYILVHKDVEKKLIDALVKRIHEFFGKTPKTSESYARIINDRALQRLEKAIKTGCQVVYGGEVDANEKYISPTLVSNVDLNSPLMTEEIFGPVLPIIPVNSIQEAIDFCNARPHPLALYIYSTNDATVNRVLKSTRSGAAVANDLLLHFTNSQLPFGGVGESGLGSYHGKLTFETFTHKRAVIKSYTKSYLDLPVRYAPYTWWKVVAAQYLLSAKVERWLRRIGKLIFLLIVLALVSPLVIKFTGV